MSSLATNSQCHPHAATPSCHDESSARKTSVVEREVGVVGRTRDRTVRREEDASRHGRLARCAVAAAGFESRQSAVTINRISPLLTDSAHTAKCKAGAMMHRLPLSGCWFCSLAD